LVVRASQAGRAELVVFLHDLLKFVSRGADHLVVIVVVVKRVTCGPLQDSLIKLTELRLWAGQVSGMKPTPGLTPQTPRAEIGPGNGLPESAGESRLKCQSVVDFADVRP